MVLAATQSKADTTLNIKNHDSIDEIKNVIPPKVLKSKPLHEKVFKDSNSYMTEFLKDEHIQTIYNIFGVALFYIITYSISHDYFTHGR